MFRPDRPDDYETVLAALFVEIIDEISQAYKKNEEKYKTVTNLFKSDRYYQDDLLGHLIPRCVDNPLRAKEIRGYVEKVFIL